MAWRPHQHLIEGELSNVVPGQVTGQMTFRGMSEPVLFDLMGDFHRDIRGASIVLKGYRSAPSDEEARDYMEGFLAFQTGAVGDITAGREPQDYVHYPYIEWYSDQNGRVVLELMPDMVTVVGKPLPWQTQKPIDPRASQMKCQLFVADLSRALSPKGQ